MKIFSYQTINAKDIEDVAASKVKVRWLITKETGAPNFAMRLFEIKSGGYSPLHRHSWEHEIFVLEGQGVVFDGAKETTFAANDVVFLPGDELHQFKNTGKDVLKFLCLIPHPEK